MHFVVKPIGNWRNYKSAKWTSVRDPVQKPLPNRRNTENRKGSAGIKIRRETLAKSTKQEFQCNLSPATDFVENLKENRRNWSVRAGTVQTEFRPKSIRKTDETANSVMQQLLDQVVSRFVEKPLARGRNRNRPLNELRPPELMFLSEVDFSQLDEISIGKHIEIANSGDVRRHLISSKRH